MTYGQELVALADPARRARLERMRRRAYTVGELAEHAGIRQPTVSQHLRVLRADGLRRGRPAPARPPAPNESERSTLMARTGADAVAPIRRSVSVSWSPDVAFQRFTADFAKWWPSYGHSIGGGRVTQVVFEARVGGRIYEEHRDGTRFMWGIVTALEPSRRVAFTHHASHAESDAQEVEVSFTPEGTGTRVELVSRGWEKMSPAAKRARGGYHMTWGVALDRYAGRYSVTMLLFIAMSAALDLVGQRGTFIRNSLGKMPASSPEEKP